MNKKSKAKGENKRVVTYKKIVRRIWTVILLGMLAVVALLVKISFDLPSTKELENPASQVASTIYADNGEVLGKFYRENRTPVKFHEISENVINALVATEDERYYSHAGIDARALGRIVVKTLLLRDQSAGGGSTISQQLAKLLFDRPSTRGKNKLVKAWIMVNVKFKEWLTAVKLEKTYTKEEIITMYLNKFEFLNGAFGIHSAAKVYFDTTPDKLTLEQAAMLVGMLKNPNIYNPNRFPERAKNRRNTVLEQMMKNKLLTKEVCEEVKAKELDMSKFKVLDHNDGLAPYFRMQLRENVKEILKNSPKPNGDMFDIYVDGLKIYTTINPRMQAHAEKAVQKVLKGKQKEFFKHWKKKDPWTYKSPTSKTEVAIPLRARSLNREIRKSDRYIKVREKYLTKAVEMKLRDVDVDRILKLEELQKKDPKGPEQRLKKWLKTDFINKKLADKYRKALGSKDWKIVKKQREKLAEYFKKKVKMKVFAYNKRSQKDTLMSPLDSIKYHRMILQSGMVAIEPGSGAVKAWVGGVNHRWFKFDHVNRNAIRQIGSTIKPLLYAISIGFSRYSPCEKFPDAKTTIEKNYGEFGLQKDWSPRNVGGFSGEMLTLIEALRKSNNAVSTQLMKNLRSTQPLRDFMHTIGIDTSKVPNQPSICLGTPDLSVLEMAGAYTTFANQGFYVEPIFIERIEDKSGQIIYQALPVPTPALESDANYAIVHLLKEVVKGAGGFNGIRSEVGGKTGTTNDQSDAWFIGITPNIVSATWVGADDRFVRYRSTSLGQGARLARPIFQEFLRNVEADKKLEFDAKKRFKMPRPMGIELDCTKYDYGSGIFGEDEEEVDPQEDEGFGI